MLTESMLKKNVTKGNFKNEIKTENKFFMFSSKEAARRRYPNGVAREPELIGFDKFKHSSFVPFVFVVIGYEMAAYFELDSANGFMLWIYHYYYCLDYSWKRSEGLLSIIDNWHFMHKLISLSEDSQW